MKIHWLLLAATVALSSYPQTDAACPKCRPCGGCPLGFRRVPVTRRVCTTGGGRCERPPPRNLGSLGFVIDDTGSMADDIAGVRAKIKSILAGNRVFKDFVVARFGDPYKRKLLHTGNPAAVKSFLNAIRTTGGGDCPEYSLSGIRDAAIAARPSSVLYLFTDASAKDAHLKASVATLLKGKGTRLFVVKSGSLCGSLYKGEYDYLAKASGGSVIHLTSKTEVKEVMKYIGLASAGRVPFKLPATVAKLKLIRPGCCKLVKTYECRKIKSGCPSGFRRLVTRKRICSGPPPPPPPPPPPVRPPPARDGSLGFVIDDTGSMGPEIAAVKSSISSIIAANRRFHNYVIARFGDPYKRRVLRSGDKSAVLAFLRAIGPSGGGDCPEFSMSGTRDAAEAALPRSVLFLFTDASAKDARLKASVAALLRRKRIRLFVVKTGSLCGSAYKGEYNYLAKASGGRVVTLTDKSGISKVMNYVRMAAAGKVAFSKIPTTLAGLKKFRPDGGKCFTQILITCRPV